MTAPETYTLEQAEDDISTLRGQVDAMGEYQQAGSIVLNGNGGANGTGGITQDGWHPLPYASGWADRGASYAAGKYRLSPDGYFVEFAGQCAATLGSGGSGNTIATLPAGYYDTATERAAPISMTGNLPGTGSPRVRINTSGGFVLDGFGSAVAVVVQLDGTRICIYSPTGG